MVEREIVKNGSSSRLRKCPKCGGRVVPHTPIIVDPDTGRQRLVIEWECDGLCAVRTDDGDCQRDD